MAGWRWTETARLVGGKPNGHGVVRFTNGTVSGDVDSSMSSRFCPAFGSAGRFTRITAGALVAVAAAGATSSAEDWPQWRGVERLGIWTETGILREFPDEGLIVKWRAPVNGGFAGPAVAGGRVFVLDYVETEPRTMDGTERILALDEDSGEVLWTREWATTYRMLMFSYATGPRATPTVDGDRLYLTGAAGRIFCLDAATGAVIWEKDTVAEYDAYVPVWGTSIAPLVVGDRVIFVVGGEPDALVMAFDKHTGEELWRALEPRTEMGYSQPAIIEAGGAPQLIVWNPGDSPRSTRRPVRCTGKSRSPAGRLRLPTPSAAIRTCWCPGSTPAR